MIVRFEEKEHAFCITQLHHSRMTGELARLWGNALTGRIEPNETVRFAAALHDIGWTSWEKNVQLNPETGHPYDFLEMPKKSHLTIWKESLDRAVGYGILPALLILRHNIGLAGKSSDENDTFVTSCIDELKQKEEQLIRQIELHGHPSLFDIRERLDILNRHILLWDYISLRMCMGTQMENPLGSPPIIGKIEFSMTVSTQQEETFCLHPWPFSSKKIIWLAEGFIHQKGKPFAESTPTSKTLQLRPFHDF